MLEAGPAVKRDTLAPAASAANGNLTMLQAGRGVAALLVVLYHAAATIAAPTYWGTPVLGGVFGFGYAGVEFFFVLSGFIILYAHNRDIGQPAMAMTYLRKRIIRIYPLYLIVTLGVFALEILAGAGRDDVMRFANGLLLISGTTDATLGVAWTLFHEIAFYLFFVLLILNRRFGVVACAVWFATCLIWFGREPPHYALASINLLFGFGMACFWLTRKIAVPSIWLWLGIICFFATGAETVFLRFMIDDVRELAFGLSAAMFICGAVCAERTGKISAPRALQVLGDASFALYLVHYPVLAIIA